MPNDFTLDPSSIGVVGLCILFVLALATGRLYTQRQMTELLAAVRSERDEARSDRDVWRDNFMDQKGLMSRLLEGQETTNRLLRAIPKVEDDA